MVEKGRIYDDARALDLGCGNGTTAIWLAGHAGCHVTGIDLSGVRIDNAKSARERQEPVLRERLAFEKASATELPFAEGQFSRVWSQAVIYHVPDKRSVLKEVYRVLETGGIFVFDDLVKPKQEVSPDAQRYVYERLLYDTEFSFESYQDALRAQGFEITGGPSTYPVTCGRAISAWPTARPRGTPANTPSTTNGLPPPTWKRPGQWRTTSSAGACTSAASNPVNPTSPITRRQFPLPGRGEGI